MWYLRKKNDTNKMETDKAASHPSGPRSLPEVSMPAIFKVFKWTCAFRESTGLQSEFLYPQLAPALFSKTA